MGSSSIWSTWKQKHELIVPVGKSDTTANLLLLRKFFFASRNSIRVATVFEGGAEGKVGHVACTCERIRSMADETSKHNPMTLVLLLTGSGFDATIVMSIVVVMIMNIN